MRLTSIIAVGLVSQLVAADWVTLDEDKALKTNCATTCSSVAPIFENDSFDELCNQLVADGCDTTFVSGQGGIGTATFAPNEDAACDDIRPAGQLTCTNMFRSALSSPGGVLNAAPGGVRSAQYPLRDANGSNLGAIAFTATCVPVDVLNPGPC